jgi:hypothetical protein
LRPHEIALIKAKLRVAFGSQFSALDFQAAVRDLQRGFPLEIELPRGAEDSPEGRICCASRAPIRGMAKESWRCRATIFASASK